MANIDATVTVLRDQSLRKYKFETMTTTNATGTPISAAEFADVSIQAVGTFGSGGSVAMEGSNDGGTTWGALNDPFGTTIALTASGALSQVNEIAELLRPHVTAGDGTTDIDVYVFARRPTEMRS